MHHHLFKLKKQCPASKRKLELTDEIKKCVIDNRTYIIEDPIKIQNQTINNYNTINNVVANMDVLEKLQSLTSYKQIEVLDFESKVEDTFLHTVKRLQHDKYKHGFRLSDNDFLDIINTLTMAIRGPQKDKFLEFLSFMYDNKRKRIKVYASDKWEEYLVDKGLTYLVNTIADCYLASYECYLIRKIVALETEAPHESQVLLSCLEEYYMFIASFEVDPYVRGKHDNMILHNEQDATYHMQPRPDDADAYAIVDRFTQAYQRIDDGITKANKKVVHKKVLDVLKTNATENVEELDKEVIGLIRMDEAFKEYLKLHSTLPL
jgi:hypothetical protein